MKSDRTAALVLMSAAMTGILFANSPFGSLLAEIKEFEVSLGFLQIDLEHVVSELLLAVFFLVAGLELKYEMRLGALSSLRVALVPISAALAGVILPATIYVALNPASPQVNGWPIPTATDIAFALGMLAIIGRGLPPAARVFLLALAIFDDVIAILIIAVNFTSDLNIWWLIVAFTSALLLRLSYPRLSANWRPLLLVLAFGAAWFAVYSSGVHATIAGVLTGLAIPAASTHRITKRISPYTNGLILPLFALFAVSIQLPENFSGASAVYLGIAIALPFGKLFGITLVGYFMNRLAPAESRLELRLVDFALVSALAGIGFTVSLLLAKLSFESDAPLQSEAIFGVLVGSMLSMIIAVALARFRSLVHRRRTGLAL